MSFNIDVAHIRNTILSMIPPEAGVSRLEFEGPEIAIYVRNPQFLESNSGVLLQIAKAVKKRLVVRTDPSIRKDKKIAEQIIRSILHPEVVVDDIMFDDVLGEVVIKVRDVKKASSYANRILVETGWRPRIIRSPPMRSRTYEEVIKGLLSQSSYRLNFLRMLGEDIHRPTLLAKDGRNYVKATFLGAAQEVGRSAILIETAESRVLLDFGLNPGKSSSPNMFPRIDLLGLDPEDVDAVIVSHAHLDHCGLVPYLFKHGYRGPVYTTDATRDLMILLIKDFLELAEREGKEPPYSWGDVERMLLHTVTLKYGMVADIAPDIRLTLYDAGHILGSAIVHLHIGNGFHNIVYTGDFKYGITRLLNRAETKFPRVDTLIMESTYGATEQPKRSEAEAQLINIVKETAARGGKTLIPVLSVGRAQEILLVLADAFNSGALPDIPVYIEGMLIEVTAIHTAYPELLARSVAEKIENGENPFNHPNFVRLEGREPRTELVESKEPAVIIATSGMLTGGPAVEYFKLMAPDEKNSLVFVSYQVEGTLGRRIKDGQREIAVVNERGRVEVIRVKMQVHSVEGFSGHSDRSQLLNYLRDISPKPSRIILVHGEKKAVEKLSESIGRNARRKLGLGDVDVMTPMLLDSYTLEFKL